MVLAHALLENPTGAVCLPNAFIFILFRTLLRSLHQERLVTPFPSTASALFAKNMGGGGYTVLGLANIQTLRRATFVSPIECALPRFRVVTSLECAVPKTRFCKSFRMRSSKKTGGRWVSA